jgi:toxin YoeB
MKRNVTLSPTALQQLEEWKSSDPKMLVKIIALIVETAESPFTGAGKPEALKYNLKGKWSRRINLEHRLVYEVKDEAIWIISCRYHYD